MIRTFYADKTYKIAHFRGKYVAVDSNTHKYALGETEDHALRALALANTQ